MVSALGFGTEENMTAVRAMKSSLASWHDSTPVCLIDRKRLGALAAERPGLAAERPAGKTGAAAAEPAPEQTAGAAANPAAAGQTAEAAAGPAWETTGSPAVTGRGGQPRRVYMYGTARPGDTGRGGRPLGVTPADKRVLIVLATTKGEIGSLGSAPERCDLNRTAEVVGRHFGAAHRPLLISNACISGFRPSSSRHG